MSVTAFHLSAAFAAGAIGGLANGVAVWIMGKTGVTQSMGVAIAPEWTPAWIYPRIVWGGLWGFLLLLPVLEQSIVLRGIFLSLGPTLAVLLVVFPFQADKGFFGIQLGLMTPVFALIVNAVWGIAAACWYARALAL